MEERIFCILGAGEYYGDETIPAAAFVAAADGGLAHCKAQGIKPDIIIGDFDSLGYAVRGKNTIELPVIKDDTDTLAAVKYGLEHGFRKFLLFGCTGGRLSHTAANIQTLHYIAKRGGIGFLADKTEVVTATCKGVLFHSDFRGFLSVFALGGETVITETGLKYEIAQQRVSPDFPVGVSNEFLQQKARVTVHSGCALIIYQKQPTGGFMV